jgi:hypothetical protein
MDEYKGLLFEDMKEENIDDLTAVMKRAFDEDSRRHLGVSSGGPPGYDNGDFLRKYGINDRWSKACQIRKDGRLIGAFIIWLPKPGEGRLGNMFIDPDLQDKGTGTMVWEFIEQKFPAVTTWRTETPGFSKRNHNFYVNKCGFNVVRILNPGDRTEESYILEKRKDPR